MCAFQKNTKHLNFKFQNIKGCFEIGKLENRFSKLCKIGKAVFQNLEYSKKLEPDKRMEPLID